MAKRAKSKRSSKTGAIRAKPKKSVAKAPAPRKPLAAKKTKIKTKGVVHKTRLRTPVLGKTGISAKDRNNHPVSTNKHAPKIIESRDHAIRGNDVLDLALDRSDESDGMVHPLPKTWLSAKQLKMFKELLLHKRAELVGDVEGLTDEALNRRRGGTGEQSHMPIHMADLGTDNWEQELTLGLIENERVRLREIDQALARIEDNTYGMCLATHKPIGVARLRVKPWATYCIDYARLRDEGRAP